MMQKLALYPVYVQQHWCESPMVSQSWIYSEKEKNEESDGKGKGLWFLFLL